MKTTNEISRRRVLEWFAIILVPITSLMHKVSPTLSTPELKPNQIGRYLIGATFYNSKSATQLGKAYMRKFPNERNLVSLLNALSTRNPSLLRIIASNQQTDLTLTLQQSINKDFEYGDVVNIDGWIVARTEARISALAKIIHR